MDLLGQRHDQLAVPVEQPLRVDERQADDLAARVEAQHVTLRSSSTVGRGLALADVQVEHVALLVVARMVKGQRSDLHSHGVQPGGLAVAVGGHDARRHRRVDDHHQPPARAESPAPVALAPRPRISAAVIRRGNGREHRSAMRLQLPVLIDDVVPANRVEHHPTAVRINRFVGRHLTAGAGTVAGANAASRRSSSSDGPWRSHSGRWSTAFDDPRSRGQRRGLRYGRRGCPQHAAAHEDGPVAGPRPCTPLVAAPQRRGIEPATEAVNEDIVLGTREIVARAESSERMNRRHGERHDARAAALRAGLHAGRKAAANEQHPAVEVDVVPPQREQLPDLQTGVEKQSERLRILLVLLVPRLTLGLVEDLGLGLPSLFARASEGLDFLDLVIVERRRRRLPAFVRPEHRVHRKPGGVRAAAVREHRRTPL